MRLTRKKNPKRRRRRGTAKTPLLWLGIGLIMLSGVGALLCVRRKWRARSAAEE